MMHTRLSGGAALAVLVSAVLLLPVLPAQSTTDQPVQTTSEDQTSVAVTVYNDGTGLVKDTRRINLPEGRFDLVFMDVASSIDPTSVHFVSLTNPDALGVLEQNYEYDLVSTQALYEKNINNHIVVRTSDGQRIEGVLLAASDGLVIQTGEGIEIVSSFQQVTFDELPEGLMTRPTLRWSLYNEAPGQHEAEMSYLTGGLGWSANYVAVVGANDDVLDLSGWVTINNTSGADYNNAMLKLVAGEVHRVQPKYYTDGLRAAATLGAGIAEGGFEEEAFFEYHLYTLQRPATVLNNQQKQISLLEAEALGVTKIFVFRTAGAYYYAGDTAKGEVEVRLKFMNSEENGLGIPIPAGIVRVYKRDSSGALQFIGEDSVDHTPKDEEIEVFLGKAFDIVGERVVKDRREIRSGLWEYDVEVTLRNHKAEDVVVTCWDNVWGDWEVVRSSHEYSQKDASTVEFLVPVESNGESVLRYTIRREW